MMQQPIKQKEQFSKFKAKALVWKLVAYTPNIKVFPYQLVV
jgi:hypothetical protein